MELPKLTNIFYYVDVNSRRFKVTSFGVSFRRYLDSSEIDIKGNIRLDQIIGKEEVNLWKPTWRNLFQIEKREVDKSKLLSLIHAGKNFGELYPIKFNQNTFENFYATIKKNGIKNDFSFPSETWGRILFEKLYLHYKEISDRYSE